MSKVWRRWIRLRIAPRAGESRRVTAFRRIAYALGALLLISEAAVALAYSFEIAVIMFASTAGLAGLANLGIQSLGANSGRGSENDDARGFLVNPETGLPNRQQLTDTLARDIARSERYSHALTLAIVRISQFEDLKASWGASTARQAVQHVAETLGRVTRASDFVAHIDEGRFAVVLLQCSGSQAALYGDRVTLAVSNRPLKSTSNVKVPLYVGVEVSALQYDSARFRGPLEFMSLAGGDVPTERPRPARGQRNALAANPGAMREQLVKDYYPDGEIMDFADAYREARNRNRHAG
ncbi:MAG TPA: diguanylate cyclase [Tepidiformaceae bacterium]|nr:diguanylate cyclase [Tepidiformaceae bacterium]HMO95810.1 diguanylate cyclase [Tepidiformaceae bacterium]